MNRGVRDAGYFGFVICTSSFVGSDCTRGVRACAECRGGRSGRVSSLCESDRDGDIPLWRGRGSRRHDVRYAHSTGTRARSPLTPHITVVSSRTNLSYLYQRCVSISAFSVCVSFAKLLYCARVVLTLK